MHENTDAMCPLGEFHLGEYLGEFGVQIAERTRVTGVPRRRVDRGADDGSD